MMLKMLFLLTLLFSLSAFSQVEESHVDYDLNPAVLLNGDIQVAYEWMGPSELSRRQLRVIDLAKVAGMHPGNNQLVVSKVALVSKQKFSQLSYEKMNMPDYITEMLDSVGISKKASDYWYVTNKVKAYGLPFKVGFYFRFKDASNSLPSAVMNYFKRETQSFAGTGNERFLTLDMSHFTQLMYRNYSVVYMKELSNGQTLIVSGLIAGIDLNKADSYFNYPPVSRTENTMMGNLEKQILHMARKIQN
jgi:hypothetical protein